MHVYTENIVPPCISWERSSSFFRSNKKYRVPEKINIIFPDNTRKVTFQCGLFERIIFSKHLKKISYFHVLFWEKSPFIFHPRSKIIFWGIRNIIFPDNTRNIFQHNISERQSFQDVQEKKYGFPWNDLYLLLAVEKHTFAVFILKKIATTIVAPILRLWVNL